MDADGIDAFLMTLRTAEKTVVTARAETDAGVLGLIPVAGDWLAAPFAWLMAGAFQALLEVSYVGASLLGCPIVSRPALLTLTSCLVVVGLFALFAGKKR